MLPECNPDCEIKITATLASRPQIEHAGRLDDLGMVQLDDFLVVCGRQEPKRVSLQTLVSATEAADRSGRGEAEGGSRCMQNP